MARASIAVLLVTVLAMTGACSDDSDGNGVDRGDTGGDVTESDTRRPDADAGPVDDISDDPGDVRRPRDTDNWDWDVGQDTAEQPFSLTEVVPPTGPVAGGERVRIVGTGFEPGTRVFFGSREMQVDLTPQEMRGRTPAASGPGPATVKAIAPDGQTETLVDGYEYIRELTVDRVTPSRVPTGGGVEVEIRGSGFSPNTAVSFSGEPALRVSHIDAELVRAVTPPRSRGPADVRVTTEAGSAVARGAVEYFAPLAIDRVTPASGLTAGGQTVTIEGEGFRSSTTFLFGGERADVQDIDPQASTATLVTPAHSGGLVDIIAENTDDSAISSDAYLYRTDDSAVLASLSPQLGPTGGGTQVVLRGYGFDRAGLEITFGDATAAIVERGSSYAVVETPAQSVGAVDVVMSDSSGELGRLSDGYEYRRGVGVDAVSPSEGPSAGGTEVTIEGSGLNGAERVEFGGIAAGFEVVSDTEIVATTPAHGAGEVDVVVEADGLQARLHDSYVYTEPLEVWGFGPTRGSIAGNTYVEVRGRGFDGELSVDFGSEQASEVQRIDRNNLVLHTPPHAAGEVPVTVEAGSERGDAPYAYAYFNPTSRHGGAAGGSVDGAVNVSVFADGGGPIPGAFVMLSTRDDTEYQGVTDENGLVTLSGPEVLGPQTVTAMAKDFSSATVEAIDAENITVFLSLVNPPPPDGGGGGGVSGPATGTIRGDVTTPGKLADPQDQAAYDMAVVRTTEASMSSRVIAPGSGSVVLGSGEYEIRSRVGDLAVVALCGVYNEQTETFDPQYVGVERYMFVSDQGEYEADIVCDIPLDQSATVKLINPVYAPDGPDSNLVRAFWDFGFEGIYEAPVSARGLADVLQVPRQPEPTGVLSDLEFTFIGGSFTDDFSPSTQAQLEGVSDLSGTVVMPPLLDVPEPISPVVGGAVENNTIVFQADGPHYPDLYSVQLLNAAGRPFWEFVIPGDENTIRLPELPDFSFLPADVRPNPMDTDRIHMTIIGIRGAEGFDYESFTYRDLSYDAWRAHSLTRWSFLPPAP